MQSLKHHQSPPNNYNRQHVYLRTPPQRESNAFRRNRQSKWAINSDLTAVYTVSHRCMQHHLHSLSKPWSVTCGYGELLLTHTPLDFPLSGARLHPSARPHLPTPHATAAHGHTPNQLRSRDCSSSPSIHRECRDRVSRFHHSSRRAFSPLGPVPTHHHFVTRTGCSCQSTEEAKAAALCSCVPRCSKSTGHSDNPTLARAAWHRLTFLDPRVTIARALLRILCGN